MAQKQLIPNVRLKDEFGNTFPSATIVIHWAKITTSIGIEAKDIGDEYSSIGDNGGGAYEISYYGTPTAQTEGYDIRQLQTFKDGEYSKTIIIDSEAVEVQRLINSNLPLHDKIVAVVKADLALKAK